MTEVLQQYTHGFACEVNLHQRVHQVLSVTVEPKNLPHSIHEGIVHCRHQESKKLPMYLWKGSNSRVATCVWIYFGADLQLCRSLRWTLLLSGTVQRASAGFPQYLLYPPHTHACQPENQKVRKWRKTTTRSSWGFTAENCATWVKVGWNLITPLQQRTRHQMYLKIPTHRWLVSSSQNHQADL